MKDEIILATAELQKAMLENLEASLKENEAKLEKIKAHKRLVLAKDKINELVYDR
jgi:hypothetical protein